MAALPDNFDLWVRRARAEPEPERQAEIVAGALFALPAWYWIETATADSFEPQRVEVAEVGPLLLTFSDAARALELSASGRIMAPSTPAAIAWCLERRLGVLVNPGEYSFCLSAAYLQAFHHKRTEEIGQRGTTEFWIAGKTAEEEDFWQENGL